jgi:MFS family permease
MLEKPRTHDDELVGEPASQSGRVIKVSASSWYALSVLTFINIFCYVDRVALSILMQSIKADLHLSDAQLGLLSGVAFALFYAVLGVPLAMLADRSSRVKLIATCLTIWSAMTAFSGMARNYPQLFLARMGVGIGEAGCVPPAHSLIGDYFPREKRALAISLFNTGAAVGVSAGMFLIGALGEKWGWRASLQIIGLAGLPLALLTFLTLREPPRPKSDRDRKETALQSIRALLSRRSFVHLAIAFSLGQVATQGFSQWAPTFLIRSFGMGMAEVGAWVGGITAGGSILGMLVGGFMAAWLLPRDLRWELWIPAGAFTICTPIFAAMVLSPAAWMVLTLKGFVAILGAIGAGVAIAAVQTYAEPYRRGTAVALVLFLASLLGAGAGPYIIGAVSTALEATMGKESLRYALLISPVMLAWAVVHYLLATRTTLKDRVN